MKYKTCVSVAEKTPASVKKILKIALSKSDFAEVRFDFLKAGDIPETLEIIKKDLNRVVCTVRPKNEGGKFVGTQKERIAIIKLVAEYNPYLLDIEYNTLRGDASLRKYLEATRTELLVSWHDFKKTPSLRVLKDRFRQMGKFSKNIKIVGTAKSTDDSTRMLELYNVRGAKTLISFAMGNYGRFSRILCLYLGSPYTYVSIGEAVAPGQFSVDEIKKITDLRI